MVTGISDDGIASETDRGRRLQQPRLTRNGVRARSIGVTAKTTRQLVIFFVVQIKNPIL